jgi:hypothetical protein
LPRQHVPHVAIVLLYVPSRWYADLKARRSDWGWLKYL